MDHVFTQSSSFDPERRSNATLIGPTAEDLNLTPFVKLGPDHVVEELYGPTEIQRHANVIALSPAKFKDIALALAENAKKSDYYAILIRGCASNQRRNTQAVIRRWEVLYEWACINRLAGEGPRVQRCIEFGKTRKSYRPERTTHSDRICKKLPKLCITPDALEALESYSIDDVLVQGETKTLRVVDADKHEAWLVPVSTLSELLPTWLM